jgi:hypothetical protein
VVQALRNLLIVCLALGVHAESAVGENLEQFKGAQRELMRLVRSKQTPERLEGIKRLQQYPLEDAVKLIHARLDDAEPDVRQAAYDTLMEMNGNYEVCETLLSLARKGVHARDGGVGATASIAILLSSKLRSTQREVEEMLDDVGSSAAGAAPVVALVDALAQRRDAGDVPALAQLTQTGVFENHRGVRRAVVQALTRIPAKDAVEVLIEIMDRAGGEARADAAEHLTQVTGQPFGVEVAAWRTWWSEAKETFQYPGASADAPYRSTVTESEAGYYYGMPLFAERLVFVLDTSASMNGQRIVAAKRELVRAIQGLPNYVQFGIITFNTRLDVWQRKLVPATDRSKQAAISYVGTQSTSSSTSSYDALEAAMAFDTEAIYFLSDGAPTAGKIVAPVEIVTAITATNKVRRISVYTIGIGAGFPGSPLDVFLKTLAEQNLGCYRRIDN